MTFSIVIPFYNRQLFLKDTLYSVLKQSYRPLIVYLVDNQSTDSSLSIAEAFQKQHNSPDFIINLLHVEKRGASAARNAALAQIETDYVYFFDSDDLMSPDFLLDASAVLDEFPIPLPPPLFSNTKMYFANGKVSDRQFFIKGNVTDQILTGMLSTQSMRLPTYLVKKIGGWNENLLVWNDWELGIRVLLECHDAVWLKKSYHCIRQHSESLTEGSGINKDEAIIAAFSAVKKLELSRKEQVALRGRQAIYAAKLYRNKAVRTQLLKDIRSEKWIYYYERIIGKGAWWLFRWYIKVFL